MTLPDILGQVTSLLNSLVPDLSAYITAGLAITLAAAAVGLLIRSVLRH